MFRLTDPRRVLIEPNLFSGRFAEREIDRVIGTVALAPKQQFFAHTSRANRLLQWATRGRNPGMTGSYIAGHAGLLLKELRGRCELLRVAQPFSLAASERPCLPFPPRNLWIGIDLSSHRMADERRADFLEAPLPRCFVWACPTEALDLLGWICPAEQRKDEVHRRWFVVVDRRRPALRKWGTALEKHCKDLRVACLEQRRRALPLIA